MTEEISFLIQSTCVGYQSTAWIIEVPITKVQIIEDVLYFYLTSNR